MAATSDLERLQCLALAVAAAPSITARTELAALSTYQGKAILPPRWSKPSKAQTKESVPFIAKKPMTKQHLDDCFRVGTGKSGQADKATFFYELFNFYVLKVPIAFWASRDQSPTGAIVNLAPGTRLTRRLMEYMPMEFFAGGTKTVFDLEMTQTRLQKKKEKLEDELALERSYVESDADEEDAEPEKLKTLEAKILELDSALQTLQTQIDNFSGFFERVRETELVPPLRVLTPFLDARFSPGRVMTPASTFALSLSNAGKALTVHETLTKVWKVTGAVERLLQGKRLSDYVFMDQNSAFMVTVKDQALLTLIENFGLRGTFSHQILSPVDLFVVQKSKVTAIMTEIATMITDLRNTYKKNEHPDAAKQEQLLERMAQDSPRKPTTYASIMRKHFDARACLGLSLKLPEKIGSQPLLKIVGRYAFTDLQDEVAADLNALTDPFTQALYRLRDHPTKFDTMIDALIEIRFDKFLIKRNIRSWTYPVTFHYGALFGPEAGKVPFQGSTPMALDFNLMTWDKAGFNGQWSKSQQGGYEPPSNWTGGFGMKPANFLFKQFYGYNQVILPALIKRRQEAFAEVITNIMRSRKILPSDQVHHIFRASGTRNLSDFQNIQAFRKMPNFDSIYRAARRVVEMPQIIGQTSVEDSYPLLQFFRLLDSEEVRQRQEVVDNMEKELADKSKILKDIPKDRPSDPPGVVQRRRQQRLALQQEVGKGSFLAKQLPEMRNQLKNAIKRTDVRKRHLLYYAIYKATVIEKLLQDMDNVTANQWTDYIRNFWSLTTDERGGSGESPYPNLDAHYIASQFAYFLFHGGKTAHLSLKKQIFMAVFGLITKSGYAVFQTFDNKHFIDDLIQTRLTVTKPSKNPKAQPKIKELAGRFLEAPYVIVS